jgi:hypothetical protein
LEIWNASNAAHRAAIERFWAEAITRAHAAGAVRTIVLDEVTSSGTLGYLLGTLTVRIPHGPELTGGGTHPVFRAG